MFFKEYFMVYKQLIAVFVAGILLAGCGTGKTVQPYPPGTFGERSAVSYRGPSIPVKNQPVKLIEPQGVITLKDALSLTMTHNPELSQALSGVLIKETGIGRSGVIPNPEMDFEAEQFGGVGQRKGFEGAEITFRVSQMIELGGKRAARIREARLERDTAAWEYEIRRLDVLTGATVAYISLLRAQEKAVLAKETVSLAGSFAAAAGEMVKAGKVAPLEEARARVTFSRERIKQEQTARELAVARKGLASFWGGTEPVFERAGGVLDSLVMVPQLETMKDTLDKNPEMARWAVEMVRYSSVVELEKRRRIPDITLSGGAGRYMDDNSNAWLMGLTVPLPLFDRNQWNRRQAEQERTRAMEERRALDVQVKTDFFRAYQELVSSYDNARVLMNEIIPAAQKTLSDAQEGYRRGKFSSLDVLEAQRTYFETREQGIDTLAAYHTAVAEVERQTGEPIEDLAKGK
jgi:outer membrane protein, heavy metal efflux system